MAYDFSEEQVTLGLRFTYDQKELAAIQKALYELKKDGNINLFSKEQLAAIEQWSKNIAKGYNTFAGITNLNKTIGTSLKSSVQLTGDILRNMNGMKDVSPTLSKGINLFNQGLSKSLLEIKTTKSILDKFGETLFNSAKWTVATNSIMLVLNNIKKITGYTAQIDKSLNNIRIVTKQSGDYMSSFLRSVNSAAQKLATTTNEYAKASLIFFQQGLNEEEVNKRTNTVIKAANVTKQAVSDVSEELTALWNGFQINQDELEASVDKLAAVAAHSASSLSEITTAISKTASIAKTLGVDLDQLNAQIATIISTTKQAPEQVGTALRTIYARMMDLAVDGTDEFGVSLGTVSSQLKEVGVNILTSTGQIKDLGGVIEEVASKWNLWTAAQKQAVAIAVGGKRQYNNLFALFENWDKYQNNLIISKNSLGELQKQQNIFLESYEAKINKLQSSWEAFIDNFRADGMFKAFLDGANGLIKALGAMTKNPFGKTMGLLGLTANLAGFIRKPLTEQVQTISYNAMMRRENEYNRQLNMSGVKRYDSTASIIDDYSRLTSAEGMRSIVDEIYSQANQKINERFSKTFSSEVSLKKQQELEIRKNEMLEKMEPLLQNMESAMNFIKDFFITYKKSNPEGYKQLFDKYADGDGEAFVNEWTAATNKKILQDTVEGKSSGLSYTEQLSHFMFNNKSMLNKIISNSELQAELLKQINDGIRNEERVRKVGIAQEIIDEEGNIIKKVPGKARGGTLDNKGINLAPIDRNVLNPGDPDRYLVQARVADGEVLSVIPKKDVKNSRQAGYLVSNGMLEYKDVPGYTQGINQYIKNLKNLNIYKDNKTFSDISHIGRYTKLQDNLFGRDEKDIKIFQRFLNFAHNKAFFPNDSIKELCLKILHEKPICIVDGGSYYNDLKNGKGALYLNRNSLKDGIFEEMMHEVRHVIQSVIQFEATLEKTKPNFLTKHRLKDVLNDYGIEYKNRKQATLIIGKDIIKEKVLAEMDKQGIADKALYQQMCSWTADILNSNSNGLFEGRLNGNPRKNANYYHGKDYLAQDYHTRKDEEDSNLFGLKTKDPRAYEAMLNIIEYFIPGFRQQAMLRDSSTEKIIDQIKNKKGFASGGLMDNKGNIVRGDGVYDNGNIVLSTIPNGVLNPGDPDRYLLQARVADGEAIQVIPKDRIQKLPGYAAGNAIYTDSYATAVLEILKKFVKQLDNLYAKSDLTNKQLTKIGENTTKVGQAKDILMTFVKNNNDIKALNKLWEKEEKKNKQYLTEATQINKEQKQRIKKENTDIKQQEQRMEKFNTLYDYTELFGQASNVAAGFQNLGEIVGTLVSGSGSFSELIPKIAALGATIKWVTNFVRTSPVMQNLIKKIPAFKEAGDILTGQFDPRAKFTEELIQKGMLKGDPNSAINQSLITRGLSGKIHKIGGKSISSSALAGAKTGGLLTGGGALLVGGAALGIGIAATAAYDKIQQVNYEKILKQTKVLNDQNKTLTETITKVNEITKEYQNNKLSTLDFKAQLLKSVEGINDVTVKLAAMNGEVFTLRRALQERSKTQYDLSREKAKDIISSGYRTTNVFSDISGAISIAMAGFRGSQQYDNKANKILQSLGLDIYKVFNDSENMKNPYSTFLIQQAITRMSQDPEAIQSSIYKQLEAYRNHNKNVFTEDTENLSKNALMFGITSGINDKYMNKTKYTVEDIENMVANYSGEAPINLVYQTLVEQFKDQLDKYSLETLQVRSSLFEEINKQVINKNNKEINDIVSGLTLIQQKFLLANKTFVNWSNDLSDEFSNLVTGSLKQTYEYMKLNNRMSLLETSPFLTGKPVDILERTNYLRNYISSNNVDLKQALSDIFGKYVSIEDYVNGDAGDIARIQLSNMLRTATLGRELSALSNQEVTRLLNDNTIKFISEEENNELLNKYFNTSIGKNLVGHTFTPGGVNDLREQVGHLISKSDLPREHSRYSVFGDVILTQEILDEAQELYNNEVFEKAHQNFKDTVASQGKSYLEEVKKFHESYVNLFKASLENIKNLVTTANTIDSITLDLNENGVMKIDNWMKMIEILSSNDLNQMNLIDLSTGNVKLNEKAFYTQMRIQKANAFIGGINSIDPAKLAMSPKTEKQATAVQRGLEVWGSNIDLMNNTEFSSRDEIGNKLFELMLADNETRNKEDKLTEEDIKEVVYQFAMTKDHDQKDIALAMEKALGIDFDKILMPEEQQVALLGDVVKILTHIARKDFDSSQLSGTADVFAKKHIKEFYLQNEHEFIDSEGNKRTITGQDLLKELLFNQDGTAKTKQQITDILFDENYGFNGKKLGEILDFAQSNEKGELELSQKGNNELDNFLRTVAESGPKEGLEAIKGLMNAGSKNIKTEIDLASKQSKASQANYLAHIDYYADISEKLRQINATISKIQTEMQHTRGASNYPNYKKLEDSFNKLAAAQAENSIVAKSQIKTFGTLLQQNGIDMSKGMVSAQLQIAAVSDQTRRQQLQEWYQQYHQGVQKDDEANKAWMDAKLQEAGARLDSLVSQALAEIEYIEVKKGIDKFNWNMSQNKQYDVQWKDFSADMRGTVRDSRYEAEQLYHNVYQVRSLYQEMSSIGKVVNGQFQISNIAHFETAKDAFDRMQKAYQAAEQNVQNIFSNLQTAYNDMKTHISDTAAEFDYLQSKIDLSNNALSTMKSLIDSTQKAGLIYFGKVDTYYKGQEEVTKRQAQMFYEETRMWKEIYDAAEEGSELQNTAWQNYTFHLQQARAKVVELANTWKQDLAEGIESAARHFEDFVLMGQRFSFGQYMDDFQTGQANKYFDEIEQLGKINSLRFTIQNDIEQSDFSDKARKKILEFYDQEEEYLKNKKDMTESDVKLTQLKYELLKKQIALEDAQNAKNSMKLVRNAAGNWSYQYVADEQKRDDLANQLNDVHQQIQDLSTQEKQNAESNYLKLQQEFVQKMREASLDDSLTENERKEQMDAYTTQYQILLEQAVKEAGRWGGVLATNTSDWAKDLNLWTDGKTYDLMSPEIQALVNGTGNGNAETFNETEQLMKDNFDNIADYADEVLARSLDTWDGYAHRIVEIWADDNGDSVKSKMQQAYDEMLEKLKEYGRGIEEVQRISDISFNSEEGIITTTYNAVSATNGLLDATKDLAHESVDTLDDYLSTIEKLDAAWRRSLNSVQNMQPIIKNMSEAIAHQVETLPELVTNANDVIVAKMLAGWQAVLNSINGRIVEMEYKAEFSKLQKEQEDRSYVYQYKDKRSGNYVLTDGTGAEYTTYSQKTPYSKEEIKKIAQDIFKNGAYIGKFEERNEDQIEHNIEQYKKRELAQLEEKYKTTATTSNSSTTSNTTATAAFTTAATNLNTASTNLNTTASNFGNSISGLPTAMNTLTTNMTTIQEDQKQQIVEMAEEQFKNQGLLTEQNQEYIYTTMDKLLDNATWASEEAVALLGGSLETKMEIYKEFVNNLVQQVATSIPDVWKNSGQELQEKRSSATINGQSYNGHLSNTGRALYTDEGYIIHFGNSANGGPGAFDTGGYTGDWSGDLGKLAILHKKEQVFSADDTALLYSAAKYLNDNSDLKNRLKSYTTNNSNNYDIDKESLSNPTYNITANFPNADDMQSIKNALLSLPNIVSQHVTQIKTGKEY